MLIKPIENSIASNSFILPPSIATKKSVHLNLQRDQNERSNLIIHFCLLSDKLGIYASACDIYFSTTERIGGDISERTISPTDKNRKSSISPS